MPELIVPVILAGGQGTRLWPLSRSARPKQFLPLIGDLSLFAETLERVSDPALYTPALILTNADYRFIVAEQALEVGAPLAGVLLEPVARNTAAAIAVAAVYAQQKFGPDAILHILASDHAIDADEGYWTAVRTAAEAAGQGWLVTFGIAPELLLCVDGGYCDRRGGVARCRLEQHASKARANLERLLGDEKAVVGIGEDQRRRVERRVQHALQRLGEEAKLANQRQKLFRPGRARQRPQARALTAGEDHGNDGFRHSNLSAQQCSN